MFSMHYSNRDEPDKAVEGGNTGSEQDNTANEGVSGRLPDPEVKPDTEGDAADSDRVPGSAEPGAVSPLATGDTPGPAENPEAAEQSAHATILRVLAELTESIARQGATLKNLFDTKILVDEQKDKIIESLHKELQAYKDNLYAKILKPAMMDIILVKDDMHKMLKSYQEKDDSEVTREKLLSLLEYYILDLGDILEKNGIGIYTCESDNFVPSKQKILMMVETDNPELDKKIARSLSYGYTQDDKVISPERVAVYTFKGGQPPEEQPDE